MTDRLRIAAQAALEALIWEVGSKPALYAPQTLRAINDLRAALAEPEAKYSDIVSDGGMDPRNKFDHPPRREWVGLTDEEQRLFSSWLDEKPDAEVFAAIEAALKEKNG